MLSKPSLANLSVALSAATRQRSERMLRCDDEFGGSKRGNEDDTPVRLQRERVRRNCMFFKSSPLFLMETESLISYKGSCK